MTSPDDSETERARRVTIRRYKRRAKAVAAVALSLLAGTFLACQKERVPRPPPAPNPTTPESSDLPAAPPESASGGAPTNSLAGSGGSTVPSTNESGGSGSGGKHNAVDRHEHRKGMPVRDNLVE